MPGGGSRRRMPSVPGARENGGNPLHSSRRRDSAGSCRRLRRSWPRCDRGPGPEDQLFGFGLHVHAEAPVEMIGYGEVRHVEAEVVDGVDAELAGLGVGRNETSHLRHSITPSQELDTSVASGNRKAGNGSATDANNAFPARVNVACPPSHRVYLTSSLIGLRSRPTLSISISQTSPAFIHTCGLRKRPIPAGVPVTITSPVSRRPLRSGARRASEYRRSNPLYWPTASPCRSGGFRDAGPRLRREFVGGDEVGSEAACAIEVFAEGPLLAAGDLVIADGAFIEYRVACDVIDCIRTGIWRPGLPMIAASCLRNRVARRRADEAWAARGR